MSNNLNSLNDFKRTELNNLINRLTKEELWSWFSNFYSSSHILDEVDNFDIITVKQEIKILENLINSRNNGKVNN